MFCGKSLNFKDKDRYIYRYPIKVMGGEAFKRRKIQFDLRFIQCNTHCNVIVEQPTEFQGKGKALQ